MEWFLYYIFHIEAYIMKMLATKFNERLTCFNNYSVFLQSKTLINN